MKASSSQVTQTNSNTGHKNISYNDKFNVYAVNIMRNGRAFQAYTDSLESAIEIRDKVYDFFKENNRLPSKEELNLKRRDKLSRPNSKDDRKNISYNRKLNAYAVTITRDCKTFLAYADSLEDALDIRDKVYDFFEENNRLPSKAEINVTRRDKDGKREYKTRRQNKLAQVNSKSGHKNISYSEQKRSFVCMIMRDGKMFNTHFDTLEEAIEIRDKVYDFFEENKRLPSKDELNLKRRANRSMKVKKTYEKVSRTCKSCGRQFAIKNDSTGLKIIEEFERRGNVCGYCHVSKSDFVFSDDERYMTRNKSGERYIRLLEHKNGKISYVVNIVINNHNVSKRFKTMGEAIEFRDKMVNFIETYNRMPTEEEKIIEFKIQKSGRKKLATSETLKDIDMKCISHDKDKNRYHVSVSRQNRTFQFYCKTLEEAVKVRRLALEMYETHGVLPTINEFRSYINTQDSHKTM